MLHENAETDVVGEDGLSLRPVRGVVRDRRVELGDEEPGLRLMLVAHDVSGWTGGQARGSRREQNTTERLVSSCFGAKYKK